MRGDPEKLNSRIRVLIRDMGVEPGVVPVGVEATTVYDMINCVSVEVGGTQVDSHSGKWMQTIHGLTQDSGGRDSMDQFVFATDDRRTTLINSDGNSYFSAKRLRVPLDFWFCKDAGQALPLVALQYHEVKIKVNFSRLLPTGSDVSLFVDYIYLDTIERQRFARSSHEYLIEQVQSTGLENVEDNVSNGPLSPDIKRNKIMLNFNHPVKELVWALYDDTQYPPVLVPSALQACVLQLNGHDRFSRRDASYFSLVQQHQFHTGLYPSAFVYSFALEPEKLQPSGTCNFSRIDNATLVLDVAQRVADGSTATAACVWAINYNVLRIKNGMGGLAYSN